MDCFVFDEQNGEVIFYGTMQECEKYALEKSVEYPSGIFTTYRSLKINRWQDGRVKDWT